MTNPAAPAIDQSARDPLAGIRVLDFTIMLAGPYCTRYLADLGADVIKIESPEGDYIRQREPKRDGCSAYFGHLNAGKRSVVLDLKQPAALAAVQRLVAQCDVLVENFRPGVMKRLGLDYPTLAAINPRLIYCSLSGFGQTGPDALRPAYAQIVQAASGYDLAYAGYQDGPAGAEDGPEGSQGNPAKPLAGPNRPANTGIFIADVLGGVFSYSAVLAALNQRHATGRGQMIDATLIEGMLSLMPYEVQEAQFPAPSRRPVYPPFKTLDGYLMVSAISPKNFEALLEALGFAQWRSDPMLATESARQANWGVVMARIEAWSALRSSGECTGILIDAGVPVTPYLTVRQALDEPQLAHRGSLATVRDGAGSYRVPNLPFKFSEGRVEVRGHVPALGEHTEQVLSEIAKLSAEEARSLVVPARQG